MESAGRRRWTILGVCGIPITGIFVQMIWQKTQLKKEEVVHVNVDQTGSF